MIFKDFEIGLEFYCGGNRWYCVDIGSKVIIADLQGSIKTAIIFNQYDFQNCSTNPKNLLGKCPSEKAK